MTLTIRKNILSLLFITTLVGTAVSVLSLLAWAQGLFAPDYTVPSFTSRWWWSLKPATSSDLPWCIAALGFSSMFPLIGEIVLSRNYGRSPSPEIFFFRVFLLTLPFQTYRLLIPLASSRVITTSWALTVTKIAWFGRFLGLTALINISLFSGDMPFRRSGYLLGMGTLISMAIAVMLPLDITQPLGNLMIRTVADTALALACITLEVLAVAALLGSGIIQKSLPHMLLALYLFLVVVGSDFIYFASIPTLIPGVILILAGTLGFARKIRLIYQWR